MDRTFRVGGAEKDLICVSRESSQAYENSSAFLKINLFYRTIGLTLPLYTKLITLNEVR